MTDNDEQTGRTDASDDDSTRGWSGFDIGRRSMLKTLGTGAAASTAMTGIASADHHSKGKGRRKNEGEHLDPLWGYTDIVDEFSGTFPSPEDFPPQIRPDHVVELHVGITVTIDGKERRLPALHFHPTGLRVEPGDILMFQNHSPHHSVTAYHEDLRGGQRVPDDVGPFSSPVLPIGGYWLYRFGEEGVYDVYCEPHELFGMVMRIVAYDGEGDIPSGYPGVEGPSPFNLINYGDCLGFESPPFHVPSSLEALASDAISPSNIVDAGEEGVHYDEVFLEFQD